MPDSKVCKKLRGVRDEKSTTTRWLTADSDIVSHVLDGIRTHDDEVLHKVRSQLAKKLWSAAQKMTESHGQGEGLGGRAVHGRWRRRAR